MTKKELIEVLRYIEPINITNFLDIYKTQTIPANSTQIIITYTIPSNLEGIIKYYSFGTFFGSSDNLIFLIKINDKLYPEKIANSNIGNITTSPKDLQLIYIKLNPNDKIDIICENKSSSNYYIFARLIGWLWK